MRTFGYAVTLTLAGLLVAPLPACDNRDDGGCAHDLPCDPGLPPTCDRCDFFGANETCSPEGECIMGECIEPFLDCDGAEANGCEVRQSDANCGACGLACDAGETCLAGLCESAGFGSAGAAGAAAKPGAAGSPGSAGSPGAAP
jgi:hypothetical protein